MMRTLFVICGTALTLITALALFVIDLGGGDDDNETAKLEVQADLKGMFAHGFCWELSLNGNGKATLTVYGGENKKVKHLQITRKKLDDLKKAIDTDRFFELPEEIGTA